MFAAHADLPRASAGIRHSQDKNPVPFTTRALWTVPGMTNRPLQQSAAQQLAGHRQIAQELFAGFQGSGTNHS